MQHVMTRPEVARQLVDLIKNGAHIYVCGATNMGNDVHHALVSIFQTSGGKIIKLFHNSIFVAIYLLLIIIFTLPIFFFAGMDKSRAEAFVKDLKDNHRYVQELWTA